MEMKQEIKQINKEIWRLEHEKSWKYQEYFTDRYVKLRETFEWTQENREKIVEVSDKFMREFKLAYDEAKKQAEILEERIKNGDPFVNDYEMEINLSFGFSDIIEKCDDEKDDYDEDFYCFVENSTTIKCYLCGHSGYSEKYFDEENEPIYLSKELNWNIEIFPKDWDENMYVSYAVHQLVCDGILSFQDFVKIDRFFSEVVVNIQKNDLI